MLVVKKLLALLLLAGFLMVSVTGCPSPTTAGKTGGGTTGGTTGGASTKP
jgi:hypothetical protein